MPFLVTPVRNNKSLLGKTKTGGEPNGKGKNLERLNTAVVAQSLVVQLKQDPYVFNPRSSRRAAAGSAQLQVKKEHGGRVQIFKMFCGAAPC